MKLSISGTIEEKKKHYNYGYSSSIYNRIDFRLTDCA